MVIPFDSQIASEIRFSRACRGKLWVRKELVFGKAVNGGGLKGWEEGLGTASRGRGSKSSAVDCAACAEGAQLVGRVLVALGDQLGYFGAGADGLDEYDLIGVHVHAIGAVQFFAALHQDVRALLGGGIGLSDDVINFRENGVRCSVALYLGIVDGAIRQQDGLVGCREGDLAIGLP